MRLLVRAPWVALMALILCVALPVASLRAEADSKRLDEFLRITGFDTALESIRLSADQAPMMLGMRAGDFGAEWSRIVGDVFATDIMHDMAREILAETLEDELLDHAVAFYDSDLGRRLVQAENASHMFEDDKKKEDEGNQIVDGLVRHSSPRLELLKRLNRASNAEGSSVQALQEIQVRFLMAAATAGVIDLPMNESDLRAAMRSQEGALRLAIGENALRSGAYTYQSFSDDEILAYAEALEDPVMQQVYTLMNAVQYEIMANRFEEVAHRLSGVQPSQDL